MLPDFRLPVDLGGQRSALRARDVPTCVFFHGFPELGEARVGRAFLEEMDRWERALLLRVVVTPVLTAAAINERFSAPVRRLPIQAYLMAVGFRAQAPEATGLLDLDPSGDASPARPADATFRAWVPRGTLRQLLALTSQAVHETPAALWAMPVSAMLFNCRVAMADELLAQMIPPAPVVLPPARPSNVIPFRPRIIDVRDPATVIGFERAE